MHLANSAVGQAVTRVVEWMRAGPTPGNSYAQSWALIYFLRQGALGNVKRRYWDAAYAEMMAKEAEDRYQSWSELIEDIRGQLKGRESLDFTKDIRSSKSTRGRVTRRGAGRRR